jgi:hypothetical protein
LPSHFFEHPPDFDLDQILWSARDRDRQEILDAVARIPAGKKRVLAMAPNLAGLLDHDLGIPATIDPQLMSFCWELREPR